MNAHELRNTTIALLTMALGCDLSFIDDARGGRDTDAAESHDAGSTNEPVRDEAPGDEAKNADAPSMDDPDTGDATEAAKLRVLLTDAPLDEVDSVFVTFSEVQIQSCLVTAAPEALDVRGKRPEREDEEEIVIVIEEEEAEQDTDEVDLEDIIIEDDDDAHHDDAHHDDAHHDDAHHDDDGLAPEDEDGEVSDDEGCTWTTVVQESVTLDLLTLQGGVTAELGMRAVAPGYYQQLRLMLTGASVVVDDQEFGLQVPSGAESGLKVFMGTLLEPGTETVLTLDFDAAQSVHYAPGTGWMMRPVIELVAETVNTIDGSDGASEPAAPAEGTPDPEPVVAPQ